MEKIGLRKIFGNSMWQISEKILTMIVTVVATSLIARYLGPEKYGLANYIISVITLFTTFSTLGMQEITIKDLCSKENKEGEILGTSFVIRIIGGIILIILSQITLYILNGANRMYQLLGIIMGTCMLFKAFEVIEYYLQAKMQLKISSIIRFITTMIVAGSKILVVFLNLGIIGFMCTYLLDAIIAGILFYIYYKIKNKNTHWKFNKEYAKNLLSKCWYIAFAGIFSIIYGRIDQVMLGKMLSDTTENGIYSAAVRIAEMWYFVPSAVVTSFQPVINAKKKEKDEPGYIKLVQQSYDAVALISIIFGILISLFGWIAVDILYGQEYQKASSVLMISVWAGLFSYLGVARMTWLINENLQKYTVIYTMAGAVVNVVLNYFIIPYMGATGAALTTLISVIVADVITLMFFKDTRKSSFMILKAIFYNETFFKLIKIIKGKMLGKEND